MERTQIQLFHSQVKHLIEFHYIVSPIIVNQEKLLNNNTKIIFIMYK